MTKGETIVKRCSRCVVQHPITVSLDMQTHCPICGEELVDVSQYTMEEEEKDEG